MQAHDKIRHYLLKKQAISEKARHLYTQGHSLQGIATELGTAKNTIRQALLRQGVTLRAHSNSQLRAVKNVKAAIKNAPYGYCLVQGRLAEDPKEIAAVRLILKWWHGGMSLGAIARSLDSQKIKPRKAAQWSQPTIGFIVRRQIKQEKSLGVNDGIE